MKYLFFIAFLSSCVLASCNNETAVKAAKNEIAEINSEVSKEKISEKISDTKDETFEIEYKPESDLEPAKTEKTEPAKPKEVAKKKSTAPKNEKPSFVKTVSKPKPKKRKAAEIEFDDYLFDFGEITEGDKVDFKFTFKNTGNAPLSITEADATCGCATPSIPFMDILPGEEGYIGVNYNSVGKEGEENPQVTIYSNAKKTPIIVLKLKGTVKPKKEMKEEKAVMDSIISEVKDTSKTGM